MMFDTALILNGEYRKWQKRERAAGLSLAKRHNLRNTAKTIRKGGCYEDIFHTAINESSAEQLVKIIGSSRYGNYWSCLMLKYLDGLNDSIINALALNTLGVRENAYYFIVNCNRNLLHDETIKMLGEAIKGNPCMAYNFAVMFPGLNEKVLAMMARGAAQYPLAAYCFARDIKNLSKDVMGILSRGIADSLLWPKFRQQFLDA